MGCIMWYGRFFNILAIFIFLFFALLDSAFGQCVKGAGVDYETKGGVVYTQSASSNVPANIWPSAVQTGLNHNAAGWHARVYISVGGCYAGGLMSATDVTGTYRVGDSSYVAGCIAYSCGAGYNYLCDLVYYLDVGFGTGHDFDCDGQDNVDDANQLTGITVTCKNDTDSDGVCNERDPWPTNAGLPGAGAVWTKKANYVRQSDMAVWTQYSDGAGHYFDTWTGGGAVPTEATIQAAIAADPNSWKGRIWFGLDPVTFAAIGVSSTNHDSGAAGDSVQYGDSGGDQALMGETINRLSDIYNRLGSNATTEGTNLGNILTKLGEIKTAVEGIQPGGQTDMGPTNSKIDATNTKLDTANITLAELRDKTVSMGEGEVPDPSSGQVSSVQDNSTVGDTENANRLDAEKSILGGFFDSWWASNPVKTIVEGSGFSASGGSSFVLSTASFGSTTIDLAPLGEGFHAIGLIIVGLAGLAGLVVVLRN
jgi:hypothetical protein